MLENLIVTVIQAYILLIFLRSILSYFPNVDYNNPLIRLLIDVTDPVLKPVRRAIGPQGGIDFSPIVVFIGLYVLIAVVQRVL